MFKFTASLPCGLACDFDLTALLHVCFVQIYTTRHARSSLARTRAIWRMALGCSKQVFVRHGGVLGRRYVTSWTNRWAAAVTDYRDYGTRVKYDRARCGRVVSGRRAPCNYAVALFVRRDARTTDNFRSKCVAGRAKCNTQVIINGICRWRPALRPTLHS